MPEIFDFPPDWSSQVSERHEYKTDIIGKRLMKPQRRCLRVKPRGFAEYRLLLSKKDLPRFDYLTWGEQASTLVLPFWPRKRHTTAEVAAGLADIVLTEAPPRDIQQDQYVVLRAPGKKTSLHTVSALVGSTLTLDPVLDQTWPAGTEVYPGWQVNVDGAFDTTRRASGMAEMQVKFRRQIGAEAPVPHAPTADLVVGGVEALVRRVNWARGMNVAHEFPIEFVDFGLGAFGFEVDARIASRTRKGTVLAKTASDVDWWAAFWDRMKGRQGEFIAPTWQQDLALQVPLGVGYDFEVPGTELGDYMAANDVYTHVYVRKKDGSHSFWEISAITPDVGLGVTRIDTTASWDEAYDPSECFSCFATRCTLATDTFQCDWLTNQVAEIPLAVTTVEKGNAI